MTDGRTDGQTDGGDCNIPDAFLKKRGDNYLHFYRYFVTLHVVINGSCCCVYTHNIRYLSLKNTIVIVLSVPPAFADPLFDWSLTFSNHTEKSIAMPYFDKFRAF